MGHVRTVLTIAAGLAFLLALAAAHLFHKTAESVWPLALIGAATVALGLAWHYRGSVPAHKGYASQGHIVVGLGVLVGLIFAMLALPPLFRPTEAASFSSLAALDEKIDQFIKTHSADSSVLVGTTFAGFDSGSAAIDCEAEDTSDLVKTILDAGEVAHSNNQRPILLLIGMTDRMPLKPALKKQYESNVGLAAARVDAVRKCLDKKLASATHLAQSMQIVRLTSGPGYSPPVGAGTSEETTKMSLDRQVNALLFSLPSSVQHTPSDDSLSVAIGERPPPERPWLRLILLLLGVTYLIGLTVAILRKLPKREPKARPLGYAGYSRGSAEALTHVREMHQMFAELRTQNFNFFIVIVAAVIAGTATLTESPQSLLPFVAAFAVACTCVIFFGIERRTVEMLGDARDELERLERPMGVNLNSIDSWNNPTGKRPRRVTHTRLYLAAFALVYVGALVALQVYFPW